MSKVVDVKILNVCRTTEQWTEETAVISKGILLVELTTDGKTLVKIGDGVKKYSELPYITDGSFSISNYYTKTETDDQISTAIQALGNIMHIKGVKATTEELPTEGNVVGDLWFVGTLVGESTDSYAEYVWTTDEVWEFIGRTQASIDLSEYAKTTYVDGKIEAVNTRLSALESTTAAINEKLADLTPEKLFEDLPIATKETTGVVKIGENLNVTEDGTVSVDLTKLDEEYLKTSDDLIFNCQL